MDQLLQKRQLLLNTYSSEAAQDDGCLLCQTALAYEIPIITTVAGAKATAIAIRSLQSQSLDVKALQDQCVQIRIKQVQGRKKKLPFPSSYPPSK